jgi:hypothetical protein
MSSPFASCVLFVDDVKVATLENIVLMLLKIPTVEVPLAVLPIISEDGGFLTLQVSTTTNDRDEVQLIVSYVIIIILMIIPFYAVFRTSLN